MLHTASTQCLPLILKAIQQTQMSIKLQGYSITSKAIASSLISAHYKGIKVMVIADKSQKKATHTQVHLLEEADIPVYYDVKPAIAHNKIIIIDEEIIHTGSYKWTQAAESRNAENLLIIKSSDVAKKYLQNFNERLAVSEVPVQVWSSSQKSRLKAIKCLSL